MMQNLKNRTHSLDSQRKLAFLRHRKISRVDRPHRHPTVEKMQHKDRAEALGKTGLPNGGL